MNDCRYLHILTMPVSLYPEALEPGKNGWKRRIESGGGPGSEQDYFVFKNFHESCQLRYHHFTQQLISQTTITYYYQRHRIGGRINML